MYTRVYAYSMRVYGLLFLRQITILCMYSYMFMLLEKTKMLLPNFLVNACK